jgi:hypothetical protein
MVIPLQQPPPFACAGMSSESSLNDKKAESISYPPPTLVQEGGNKSDIGVDILSMSSLDIERPDGNGQAPTEVEQVKEEQKPSRATKFKKFMKTFIKQYWWVATYRSIPFTNRSLNNILHRRFLMGLGIVIVLAWRFPGIAKKDGVIHSEWSIKWGKGL